MKKLLILTLIQLSVLQTVKSQNTDLTAVIQESMLNKLFKAMGEIKGTSSYSFMFIDGTYDWKLVNPQIKLHNNKADFVTDVKVTIGSYSYQTKVTGNVEVCYEPTTNLIYVEITEALFPLNIMFFGKSRHLWDVNLKKYFETPFTFEGPLTMGTEMVFDMPDNTQKKLYTYPKNCGVKVVEKQIIVTAEMEFVSRNEQPNSKIISYTKTLYDYIYDAFIITLLIPASLFAGEPQPGYNIKIVAKGIPEGSTCLLANYYGEKQYIKDSAKVIKGEVVFKGETKWDQGIYLFVPPSKRYFDFVMDEGQHFSLEADTADYIKTMKVKGSEENKIFYEYQTFMASKQKQIEPLREQLKKVKAKDSTKIIQDKITSIDEEVKSYRNNLQKDHPTSFVAKLMKAMQDPEIPEAPILANGKKDSTFAYRYYKAHFWDNIDFSDDRMLRTPIFHPKIKQYMEKLTAQGPDYVDSINASADYIIGKAKANQEVFKYVVYWLTYNYESSNIMGMDAVFVHLVEQYYVTKQAFWVDSTQLYKITNRAYTLKPLLIGKKAPFINMPDSTGKYVSLYDLKSKYTVVMFWDHGCGHCKKEIPKLVEQYNTKLKAKGVQVYAIETEDKPDEWKKFIKENKLNWINVCEPDEYKRAVTKKIYDIYSTPVIYLLDENKIIKAKRIDSEQIANIIEMLDKEKEKKK